MMNYSFGDVLAINPKSNVFIVVVLFHKYYRALL